MAEPIIDTFSQRLGVLLGELASAIQRKLRSAGVAANCYHGYDGLLHRFHDTQTLHLDGSAVNSQIGMCSQVAQFFVRVELEHRFVLEYAFFHQPVSHSFEGFGTRSLTRKMQLDAFVETAVTHCFQQGGLVFLYGEAADVQHIQRTVFVQVVFRRRQRARTRFGDDTVGDDLEVGVDMITHQAVIYVLRRALNPVAVFIDALLPVFQHQFADVTVLNAYLIKDILRMDVIGGGDGFAQPFGYQDDPVMKREELFYVHHVGPANSLLHHLQVFFGITAGEAEPVVVDDRLEDGELEQFQLVFRFRTVGFGVGARQDAHLLSGQSQFFDGTSGRDGHAVALDIKVTDYK